MGIQIPSPAQTYSFACFVANKSYQCADTIPEYMCCYRSRYQRHLPGGGHARRQREQIHRPTQGIMPALSSSLASQFFHALLLLSCFLGTYLPPAFLFPARFLILLVFFLVLSSCSSCSSSLFSFISPAPFFLLPFFFLPFSFLLLSFSGSFLLPPLVYLLFFFILLLSLLFFSSSCSFLLPALSFLLYPSFLLPFFPPLPFLLPCFLFCLL